MYPRHNNFNGGNRFGGPVIPFLLGGVVGSLWANNGYNNHNNFVAYPVYPYPMYYYPRYYY